MALQWSFWFAVSTVLAKRELPLTQIAAAVAAWSAILTAGHLTRYLVTYSVGFDPGLFTFKHVINASPPVTAVLGQVGVFEVWAVVVLASGLAEAWQRRFALVLPLTIGVAVAGVIQSPIRHLHS